MKRLQLSSNNNKQMLIPSLALLCFLKLPKAEGHNDKNTIFQKTHMTL